MDIAEIPLKAIIYSFSCALWKRYDWFYIPYNSDDDDDDDDNNPYAQNPIQTIDW